MCDLAWAGVGGGGLRSNSLSFLVQMVTFILRFSPSCGILHKWDNDADADADAGVDFGSSSRCHHQKAAKLFFQPEPLSIDRILEMASLGCLNWKSKLFLLPLLVLVAHTGHIICEEPGGEGAKI